MLVHFDHFIRVDDGQIKPTGIMFGKLRAYYTFTSNKVHTHAIFASCLNCTQHYFTRRFVTPHGIQGNPNSGAHAFVPSGSPMVARTRSRSSSRSNGL